MKFYMIALLILTVTSLKLTRSASNITINKISCILSGMGFKKVKPIGGSSRSAIFHTVRKGNPQVVKVYEALAEHEESITKEIAFNKLLKSKETAFFLTFNEVLTNDKLVFMVMDVAAGSLNDLLDSWKREDQTTLHDTKLFAKLEIVKKMADMLMYLNTLGIAYFDIKPDNMVVLETGEVKGIDLGGCYQLYSKKQVTEFTKVFMPDNLKSLTDMNFSNQRGNNGSSLSPQRTSSNNSFIDILNILPNLISKAKKYEGKVSFKLTETGNSLKIEEITAQPNNIETSKLVIEAELYGLNMRNNASYFALVAFHVLTYNKIGYEITNQGSYMDILNEKIEKLKSDSKLGEIFEVIKQMLEQKITTGLHILSEKIEAILVNESYLLKEVKIFAENRDFKAPAHYYSFPYFNSKDDSIYNDLIKNTSKLVDIFNSKVILFKLTEDKETSKASKDSKPISSGTHKTEANKNKEGVEMKTLDSASWQNTQPSNTSAEPRKKEFLKRKIGIKEKYKRSFIREQMQNFWQSTINNFKSIKDELQKLENVTEKLFIANSI